MTIRAEDRRTLPNIPDPGRKQGDSPDPVRPDVKKPEGGNELMRRLKKVDPDQAKKYRQRSGE
ncbi:MAG TPA: ubiquitin-like protein UBact [Fimbriimonadaceae bacterium]|nr:ubiquitin-like protein UBact [Fimbriimonadaceae bacterium]